MPERDVRGEKNVAQGKEKQVINLGLRSFWTKVFDHVKYEGDEEERRVQKVM